MELAVLLAILLTLSAVASAVFATDRGRPALTWFVLGLVAGPIAVAVILAQPAAGQSEQVSQTGAPARQRPRRTGRVLNAVALLLLVPSLTGMGVLEARERWRQHSQTEALTGLLRRYRLHLGAVEAVAADRAASGPEGAQAAR
ncbi:MAG: hypothetical protein AB1505_02765 [Candidatus Latescibacterota bacterium]